MYITTLVCTLVFFLYIYTLLHLLTMFILHSHKLTFIFLYLFCFTAFLSFCLQCTLVFTFLCFMSSYSNEVGGANLNSSCQPNPVFIFSHLSCLFFLYYYSYYCIIVTTLDASILSHSVIRRSSP